MADIRTTGLLDDFNRADENPLSGGGNWAFNQFLSNQLKLASNTAVGIDASTFQGSYWTPSTFSDDMEVWGTVSGDAGENNTGWLLGFMKEMDGATTADGYYFQIRNPVGAWTADIQRVANDVPTAIKVYAEPPSLLAGHLLLMQRVGDDLTVYHSEDGGANWTAYGTPVTDTTYMTGLGVFIGVDNGTSSLPGWTDVGGGEPIEFVPQIMRYR